MTNLKNYFVLFFMLIIPLMPVSGQEIIGYDRDFAEQMQKNQVRLVVIRHGEGIHNINGIMTSSRSPGVYLTENGIEQVKQSASELALHQVDFVYVSPMYRTLQTAQHLAMILEVPHHKIIVDDRLREQSFGDYEGYTWEEYESKFPTLEAFDQAAPNGETGFDVLARTHEFLRHIFERHPGQTVLLVTHGYNCSIISIGLTGNSKDHQTAGYAIYPPQG